MLLVYAPCKRRAIYAEFVDRKDQVLHLLQLGFWFGGRSAGFLVQCHGAVRCALSEEDDLDRQVVPETG